MRAEHPGWGRWPELGLTWDGAPVPGPGAAAQAPEAADFGFHPPVAAAAVSGLQAGPSETDGSPGNAVSFHRGHTVEVGHCRLRNLAR